MNDQVQLKSHSNSRKLTTKEKPRYSTTPVMQDSDGRNGMLANHTAQELESGIAQDTRIIAILDAHV